MIRRGCVSPFQQPDDETRTQFLNYNENEINFVFLWKILDFVNPSLIMYRSEHPRQQGATG